MNVAQPEPAGKRLLLVIVAIVALFGFGAWVYFQVIASSTTHLDQAAAMRIIGAAEKYTRDLHAKQKPIPAEVSLKQLVDLYYLKPQDADAFRDMDVTLGLTTTNSDSAAVVMRVHFHDGGSDIQLLEDGTPQLITNAPKTQ